MEYQLNITSEYRIPPAILTLDIKNIAKENGLYQACKSCQCNCHLCRGHRTLELEKITAENVEALFAETLKQ